MLWKIFVFLKNSDTILSNLQEIISHDWVDRFKYVLDKQKEKSDPAEMVRNFYDRGQVLRSIYIGVNYAVLSLAK